MKKSVDVRLLVVAVLFGFLGGAASSLVMPRLALAQGGAVENVTAQSFSVVDPQGRVLAMIDGILDPDRRVTTIRPGEPTEVYSLVGSIRLFDSDGRVYWSLPRPLLHPLSSGQGGE
jgi:uncharacterized membrane protein